MPTTGEIFLELLPIHGAFPITLDSLQKVSVCVPPRSSISAFSPSVCFFEGAGPKILWAPRRMLLVCSLNP